MAHIQKHMFEDIALKSQYLDEDGFVMFFKDLFRKSENYPNNFDAWTVKQQCDWLHQNFAKFFPNVPQSLQSFIPAAFCKLDYKRSPEKLPEWMDMDTYRKGQKFVEKHYFALIISKLIGLMYAFTFNDGMRTMILGEQSHTPYLGFQKYSVSIKRIFSWYSEDPWIKGTEAYKNMQVTRGKHIAITKKVCQMNDEQIAAACTFANPWCPDRELLLKDFAAACPSEKFDQRPYIVCKNSPYKPKGINNADLAIVQGCFIALTFLCPQNVGIHDATDEDLKSFCHMWKCYGYFLGMEDEYNFCRGSFEEIKQRVHDLFQYWTIQNLSDSSPEWEHISRCLVEQFNFYPSTHMSYKAMVLIAADALNINMPHLYTSLNYTEWITYKIYKFIFYAMKFSYVGSIINILVHNIIVKVLNFDEKKKTEIHKKSNKILPDFSLTY